MQVRVPAGPGQPQKLDGTSQTRQQCVSGATEARVDKNAVAELVVLSHPSLSPTAASQQSYDGAARPPH